MVTVYGKCHVISQYKCLYFVLVGLLAEAVSQCPIWLFSEVSLCRAVQVYCPDYFLNDSDMVEIAFGFTSISTSITFVPFVLIFHFRLRLFFFNIFGFFLDHISTSWNCSAFYQACYSLITKHLEVWFILRDGSVSVRLLVSQYDSLTTYYQLLLIIPLVPLSPVTEWTSVFTLQFITIVTRIFNLFDVYSV